MPDKIRVLLVDDAAEIRDTERALLAYAGDIEIIGEAENGAVAIEMTRAYAPDIVLMDIQMPVQDGIEATRRIVDECPGSDVVIVSVQDEFDSLKRAMQAGAKEYLLKPFTSDSMVTAIRSVARRQEKWKRVTTNALLADRVRSRAHVVALLSASGGSGKTTVAVNVAVSLASQGKRTVIVDCDLAFGDVGAFLGFSNQRRNLHSLYLEGEAFADLLPSYLHVHESGLHVLLAPESVEEGEAIAPVFIQNVVRALRKEFDYIVLDTGTAIAETAVAAFAAADEWWLTGIADLASAKNNRRLEGVLTDIGYDLTRVRHILIKRGALSERALTQALGQDLYATIAFDAIAAGAAIDLGLPLVLEQKNRRAARDLQRLTAKLTASERRSIRSARRSLMQFLPKWR